MLIAKPKEYVEIQFVYQSGYEYIDPTGDIIVYLKRGIGTPGAVIDGPLVYDISYITAATPTYTQSISSTATIERVSQGSYKLRYMLPESLYKGNYTIQISTVADLSNATKEYYVQCNNPNNIDEEYSYNDKSISISSRSKYVEINNLSTNSIMLIGHTDALQEFEIYRPTSMQDAINVLRADFDSPLTRGIFDCYAAGGRDIYIMSCGSMSEYVSDVSKRNDKIFADTAATPNTYSFYEFYGAKLSFCYEILSDYEFIDIIVPLETSFISTNGVNFVKQLADHCQQVQTNTGEVQMGIIGSRSSSARDVDINDINNADFEISSSVTSSGEITKDSGKYIILIYGEAVFNHKQIRRSYTSSMAAAYAGSLSSNRIDYGMAKKRIEPCLSIFGNEINSNQMAILENKKVNTIFSGSRARRGALYDVRISGDLTQSISENYSDSSNVRLVAMVIAEVQSMGQNSIGKFANDHLIRSVDGFLQQLKINDIIRDYNFDAYADRLEKGKLYFTISITSVRTLRSISFNVATGRGA
jgi:hypothetical protein